MRNVFYLYGIPFERLSDGVYCQAGKGRPAESGTYGESTELRRIPRSLLAQVDELLAKAKSEWDAIREGVLNNTYTSPEIDLNNFHVVPRPKSDADAVAAPVVAPVAAPVAAPDVVAGVFDAPSTSGSDASAGSNSTSVKYLTKRERKALKFSGKNR